MFNARVFKTTVMGDYRTAIIVTTDVEYDVRYTYLKVIHVYLSFKYVRARSSIPLSSKYYMNYEFKWAKNVVKYRLGGVISYYKSFNTPDFILENSLNVLNINILKQHLCDINI